MTGGAVFDKDSKVTENMSVNGAATRMYYRGVIMTKGAVSLPNLDPNDPRPLKVSEGVELSTLGVNQFYAAIHRGEVPSIRVGRRILLPRKAFLAWLNGGPNAA
jgi:excisionase family DNA binding protein